MQFFRAAYENLMVAINRSYFEADHGRVNIALERLQEIANEFPDDAHIIYAQGTIRRDYLGQGVVSRALFEKAYNLSVNSKPAGETRWFALCNLACLARDKEELSHWVEKAMLERRRDKSDFQHFIDVSRLLQKGVPYTAILMDESQIHMKAQDYGLSAAVLDIALHTIPIVPDYELSSRHCRALSFRALDSKAERIREANAEAFPPDERFALHEAVREVTKCITLDGYDATLWNYKSAWCVLLARYDEAISCADRAIELRPNNYPRPHINKTQALWALGRDTEAIACAREAVHQVEAGGESPVDIKQVQALLYACSQPRIILTLDNMKPVIQQIIKTAHLTSEEEFGQTRARATRTTIDKVVQRLIGQIQEMRHSQFKEYIPIMVELLSDFTPETVFCASIFVAQHSRTAVEYLLISALYLAVKIKGVLRRDATRYFCLMTLVFIEGTAIRAYYRSSVLETSAAASDEMSNLDNIMRAEMGRINPSFPQLIAEQEPVDEEGRQRAFNNILSQLA